VSGPDEQFVNIHYKYFYKDELNTFNNSLTKDLFAKGTVTIDSYLTNKEQNLILRKAFDLGFFNLPDTLNYAGPDSIKCKLEPDPGLQYLRIKYKNKDKTVCWFLVNSCPAEYKKIIELTSAIKDIIESDFRYKILPDREGTPL